MLASQLALTVLLVSLGSALAEPVESKTAARHEPYSKSFELVIRLRNENKEFDLNLAVFVAGSWKLLKKGFAPAEQVKDIKVKLQRDDIVIVSCGNESAVGFALDDLKLAEYDYRRKLEAVCYNRPKAGLYILSSIALDGQRFYKEQQRCEEERR